MRNDSHIVVHGWMASELKLVGNDLLVYALVYGFSQDGESVFYGSLDYASKNTGLSIRTISRILNSLTERGLLAREEILGKGVRYCVTLDKLSTPPRQNVYGQGVLTLDNLSTNKKDYTNTVPIDSDNKSYTQVCAKFTPPTYQQVLDYAKSRGRSELAKRFYDSYTVAAWKDSRGKQIINWKQKFIAVWEANNNPIGKTCGAVLNKERNYDE